MRLITWGFALLLVFSLILGAQQKIEDVATEDPAPSAVSSSDCTFLNNPTDYLRDDEVEWLARTKSTIRPLDEISRLSPFDPGIATVDAATIPHKNFIDDAIFSRMVSAGIASAPLTTDVEFMRRVTLDLTGRIPSPTDLANFLANTNPSKRDALVDSLIGTPEFNDKWTLFFGDLFKNNANASNVNRYLDGRDAFYLYIKDAVARNRPYDEVARELIAGTGDNFVNGAANWIVGTTVPMGPAQDTYDGSAAQVASTFLGIGAVDCLLCHDGARHLDTVNLWGSQQTRMSMWGLSAYFARERMTRMVVTQTPQLFKYIVSDAAAGNYNLNTTTGNRSARQPVNGQNAVQPKNPFLSASGGGVANETYRQAIARQITGDLQFSRAAVNYIWEKFMVEAFVSPTNSFDLARLDPNNLPPNSWALQPTNPQLLDQLAQNFQQNRYDIRALMSLIVKSNAYQLSSAYPSASWNLSYVPYYARHYVRRMDAEEIHDAILKATGIGATYPLQQSGLALPDVQWAMQLPDTREPNRVGAAATFLNAFGRGDRDLNQRRSDGSVIQALNLMNNTFVMTRIHQNNAGSRVATLLSQSSDPATIIGQLFLSTLSRPATSAEVQFYMPMFQQQGVRVGAESLQWILLNKLEFVFNY